MVDEQRPRLSQRWLFQTWEPLPLSECLFAWLQACLRLLYCQAMMMTAIGKKLVTMVKERMQPSSPRSRQQAKSLHQDLIPQDLANTAVAPMHRVGSNDSRKKGCVEAALQPQRKNLIPCALQPRHGPLPPWVFPTAAWLTVFPTSGQERSAEHLKRGDLMDQILLEARCSTELSKGHHLPTR